MGSAQRARPRRAGQPQQRGGTDRLRGVPGPLRRLRRRARLTAKLLAALADSRRSGARRRGGPPPGAARSAGRRSGRGARAPGSVPRRRRQGRSIARSGAAAKAGTAGLFPDRCAPSPAWRRSRPDAGPDDILPALARNVVTNGYQASHNNEALEQTEYLKLVHRYLSQARELEKLAGRIARSSRSRPANRRRPATCCASWVSACAAAAAVKWCWRR